MKTLYVDVYFLINFTIDILALYFASIFCKTACRVYQLVISSFFGALSAVIGAVFIVDSKIVYIVSALTFFIMIVIVTKGVTVYRKIKYAVGFLLFEILIGGLVYYGYCLLDRLLENSEYEEVGSENRNLLILSLIVLLSMGILKLIISFLGSVRSEKNVKLIVSHFGRETFIEALVDSGNLAVDPMDRTPVMLINLKLGKKIFGQDTMYTDDFSSLNIDIKKRLRIIPVCFGGNKKILYGIKPDLAYAVVGKRREKISIVIAIDKEEDSFGGYEALIPLAALEDVFYGNY